MPYISIKVAGQLSNEQKSKIVDQMSTTMLTVANKPKASTYITIEEIPRSNWGKGGEILETK
jgi:4-oxalocrotonate tautomerase